MYLMYNRQGGRSREGKPRLITPFFCVFGGLLRLLRLYAEVRCCLLHRSPRRTANCARNDCAECWHAHFANRMVDVVKVLMFRFDGPIRDYEDH